VGSAAASEPEVADTELAAVLADEAVVLPRLHLLLHGQPRALPLARTRAPTAPAAAPPPPHLRRPIERGAGNRGRSFQCGGRGFAWGLGVVRRGMRRVWRSESVVRVSTLNVCLGQAVRLLAWGWERDPAGCRSNERRVCGGPTCQRRCEG
jgi:hypothetical protein